MSKMELQKGPDFDALEYALTSCPEPIGAAHAHGLAVGVLCVQGGRGLRPWLDELDALDVADTCKELLVYCFAQTLGMLEDPDMGFYPLSPDEQQPPQLRVGALGEWCDGMLSGLGVAGLAQEENTDVQEIMTDLGQIAQIDDQVDEADEELEVNYQQLLEFVRIAALTVFECLRPLREQGGKAS